MSDARCPVCGYQMVLVPVIGTFAWQCPNRGNHTWEYTTITTDSTNPQRLPHHDD